MEPSSGVNTTIEYILRVTGISPQFGSLYGGTTVTITGSGFSPVLEDNKVTLGTVPGHNSACKLIVKPLEEEMNRMCIITSLLFHA